MKLALFSRRLATLLGFGVSLLIAQTPTHPPAPTSTVQAEIQKVIECLPEPAEVRGESTCDSLATQMAALHVPGVSIAVIHNGVIAWAQGFGVMQAGGRPVTADTLFQAGSISKPLAAMAALHQVQIGKLALDTDVNTYLTSWKVPPSTVAPGTTVTLRELLTHTAGFTVHGFPGYAAGAPVPTVVQVLNGEKPANTPAIRLESVPGDHWNYSGGGFTVMQQVVLDVTKVPFPTLLHDTELAPIGMTHSTYEQPLPAAIMRDNAATPYTMSGAAVPGGARTYPEMAAAGLWTTPSDLARYILEVQQSLAGKANHVLSPEMTQQMLTRGKGDWGLGVEVGGKPDNPFFTHGGVNEGFESVFVGYTKTGEGAVIMTNAQGGGRLAEAVLRSIAEVYGWPDFHPIEHPVIKVAPATLEHYLGTYQLQPGFTLTISMEGGELFAQATQQGKVPIYAESETKFFVKEVDAEIEFLPAASGKGMQLILHQNGQHIKGTRK